MLFVSLLQGFGLLPGKAAARSGSTAPGVGVTGKGDADVAVAEKPLSGTSKAVINRASSKPAPAGRATQPASTPPSGTEESPRRQAVKKTAVKSPQPDVSEKKAGKKPAAKADVATKEAVKAGTSTRPSKTTSVKAVVTAPSVVTSAPKVTPTKVAPTAAEPAAKGKAAVKSPAAVPETVTKAIKAGKAVQVPIAKTVADTNRAQTGTVQPNTQRSAASTVSKKEAVALKAEASVPASAPHVTLASAAENVAVPVPTRRGGRKPAAASVPVPQPVPSHSPDAAKATFSNIPERVMNLPVHTPARKDPTLANNWKSKPADQLTDQEVLSMPDGEYMNDVQMAFFRHKLVTLKEGILANAGETTEHLREDTVVVPDPADRATIEEEHALELRTRDRERKLLKKIEQSIARIDAGDYGYCDETGEPIGVGRLIARPTASLSLEAQQRRELKQKMFGD